MSKVIEITDLKEARRTQLDDVTSAFYFSRLPREERIGRTLLFVLAAQNAIRKPESTGVFGADLKDIELGGVVNLLAISEELAKYSVKDFAVRPGRIDG